MMPHTKHKYMEIYKGDKVISINTRLPTNSGLYKFTDVPGPTEPPKAIWSRGHEGSLIELHRLMASTSAFKGERG